MNEVIGIKEQNTNQISYVYCNESYELGDMLLIGNGKGEYVYECVRLKEQYNEYAHKIMESISVRKATSTELLEYMTIQQESEKFKTTFKAMLRNYNINALLLNADIALDGEHIRYTYFSVDKLAFPKMIKYLLMNSHRRMKIEFYQVGEREYYTLNGGLGVCGYELCCHSRSHHTPTITTNSLKDLGLNISLKKSLTGSCGKYKCCLLFRERDKQQLKQNLPDLDTEIKYLDEVVTVTQIDFESQTVTALGKEVVEIHFDYFLKEKKC